MGMVSSLMAVRLKPRPNIPSSCRRRHLPKPFVFVPSIAFGENLCVEFIIWKLDPKYLAQTTAIRSVTAGSKVKRAYFFKWTTSQASAAMVDALEWILGLQNP